MEVSFREDECVCASRHIRPHVKQEIAEQGWSLQIALVQALMSSERAVAHADADHRKYLGLTFHAAFRLP